MTDHDFVCWLIGFEASLCAPPTPEQWALVVEQLRGTKAPPLAPPRLGLPSILFGPGSRGRAQRRPRRGMTDHDFAVCRMRGDYLDAGFLESLVRHFGQRAYARLPRSWRDYLWVTAFNLRARAEQRAIARFDPTTPHDRGDHAN